MNSIKKFNNFIGLAVFLLLVFSVTLAMADEVVDQTQLKVVISKSFQGDIFEPKLLENAQPDQIEKGQLTSPDTLDLVKMSRWGLRSLLNNPDPEHGYLPRFALELLGKPPYKGHGMWEIGDIAIRWNAAIVHLRQIVGQDECSPIEDKVSNLYLSRLRDDGLIWCPPNEVGLSVEAVSPWTNGLALYACAERYISSGDKKWKQSARKLFEGLKNHLVTWENEMAYYRWWASDLKETHLDNWMGPNSLIDFIIRYWQATGDPEALQFATSLAEGVLGHAQPMVGNQDFKEDGGYIGHIHMHTSCMRGMIAAGLASGDHRYIEWGKRVYDFTKGQYGTDTGWLPEWIECAPGHEHDGETCCTADMAGAAADLGRAGFTECYDDLERSLRNYMRWTQFFVTPEFENLYRQRNGEQVDAELILLRKWEGGFIASPEPSDLVSSHHDNIDMMACCACSSNLVLWNCWNSIVTSNKNGLFINMSINHETPDLKVISYAPNQGRLTVKVKNTREPVHLRPPSWTLRQKIKAYRNGKPCQIAWWGRYVRFENLKKGDELTITYPVVCFKQKIITAKGYKDIERTYIQSWVGNTIVDITPRGKLLPIFNGPALSYQLYQISNLN